MMMNRLLRDEKGATAIEYGLLVALISLACTIAFLSIGVNMSEMFFYISDKIAGL
jgi:pilus assembly protein Flp/PilA